MEDTSGFYFSQDGGLAYGPNFVEHKDYSLYREKKDEYQYPVGGWYWFDSEEEARVFFNLPPRPIETNTNQQN